MKRITFITAIFLGYTLSVAAQTDPVIDKPISINPVKRNPVITKPITVMAPPLQTAFRMTNTLGLVIKTDNPASGPQLFRQVDYDAGSNIENWRYVAPIDGIYHFDARFNFYYQLESILKHERWYMELLNGTNVIDETVLSN